MRITNLLLLTGLLIGSAGPAAAQAGTYDLSFGTNGAVTRLPFPTQRALGVDHQGRLIAAGAYYEARIPHALRFLPNGTVDPSFNGGQPVRLDLIRALRFSDIAVDSTDGLLFAFNVDEQRSYAALARYREDGTLDSTFGLNGTVLFPTLSARDGVQTAFAKDGLVYLAARDTLNTALCLVRLRPNGQPDESFGVNGLLKVPFSFPHVGGMVTEEDGRVVVAGSFGGPASRDLFVLRLNPDGSLDTTFGSAGTYTRDYTMGIDEALSMERTPDGGYVVGGYGKKDAAAEALILRLQHDGTPQAGFGDNGFVLLSYVDDGTDSYATGVHVRADGGVQLGGPSTNSNGATRMGLAGLLTDGSLDPAFAGGGRVRYSGSQFNYIGLYTYAALVTESRIYVSGDGYPQNISSQTGWVAAFQTGTTVATEPAPAADRPTVAVYPNPVSGAATVSFRLRTMEAVRVRVLDLLGREVMALTSVTLSAGEHRLPLNLSGVAPGVYLVRVAATSGGATQRIVVR